MRALIDTNIALTYVSGREDRYAGESVEIMRMCAEERIEGLIAFHSLSTIWYVLRQLPDRVRRDWIRQLCLILKVSGADNNAVLAAIDNLEFRDFEDALQDCCAACDEADYIVTANLRDYEGHSRVKAVTPDVFITIVSQA